MYSKKVLDHFQRPRHVGEIPNPSVVVEVSNPVCGDMMKLWVIVADEKVRDAKFKVAGCVPAVACGSWLAETIVGKPLASLNSVTAEKIEAALDGLPPASRHASVLAADALNRLLEKLRL